MTIARSTAAEDSGIADIEPARQPLTLSLAAPVSKATIYEPSFSAAAKQTYANAAGLAGIPLSVPDHLLVIELVPMPCT